MVDRNESTERYGYQLVAGFFRAEFGLEAPSGKDWLRYERTV